MRPMTDDADVSPTTPDPDDHVARLQAQIDAAKARRASYREGRRDSRPRRPGAPDGRGAGDHKDRRHGRQDRR
jgi:hypothetical protein